MMRTMLAAVLAGFALLLGGCATLNAPPRPLPPTPDEVVQMSQAGRSAEDIIKLMRDSRAVYELSASQLADLRQRGVADKVIDYMQATYLEQARRDEALRHPYYIDAWGYWGHGYPGYGMRYGYRWPYWGPHPYWW